MGRVFSGIGPGPDRHRIGAEPILDDDGQVVGGGTLEQPIKAIESTGSRSLDVTPTSATLRRTFNIFGTEDTIEAQTFGPPVGDVMPGSFTAVRRNTTVATDQIKGTPILRLEVVYERQRAEGITFMDRDDFRVSGESVTITAVKKDADAQHFPDGSGASKDGRVIGLDKNTNEAEGVSVLDPILLYTALRHLNTLTSAQLRAIADLEGKVNSGDFYGFDSGEVLFVGANIGDARDQGVWVVRYDFQIRRNRTSNPIIMDLIGDLAGSSTTEQIEKEGWQFLTVNIAEDNEKAAAQYAHVWNVYEKRNLLTLPGMGSAIPWEGRSTFPPILSSIQG